MDRSELERLDRDTLVERATDLGVSRARVLTRAELVDELIVRGPDEPQDKQRARGFFGVARDLLAQVVEQGLHLPDAAGRIRSYGALPPATRTRVPSALPTVTLAEIYAAQGHISRAVDTIQSVLVREPDHGAAQEFLLRLTAMGSLPEGPPRRHADNDEAAIVWPSSNADRTLDDVAARDARSNVSPEGCSGRVVGDLKLEGPPSDLDECIAIRVDPQTLFVYWALRLSTMRYLAARLPSGGAVLRLVVVKPSREGPITDLRDSIVTGFMGDTVVCDLPQGAIVRAAVGWKSSVGDFHPAAHSPALESAPSDRSEWGMGSVFRAAPGGLVRVCPEDRDAPAIVRALARARRETLDPGMAAAHANMQGVRTTERWIYAPQAWAVPAD
ncbi:MAG: hypothetical protein ABTD50_04405 [Polyangiaceae bacterium]